MMNYTIRSLVASVALTAGVIGMSGCAQNPSTSGTGTKADPGAPAGGNMNPSGVGVTGAGAGTGSSGAVNSGASGGTATGGGR